MAETKKIEKPEIGEYKGHAVISIPLNDGRPYTMGKKRAAAIVEHYEAIKKFAEGAK